MKTPKKGNPKLLLGLALVFLGFLLVFARPEKVVKEIADYTFAQEPVKVEGFSTQTVPQEESPSRIIIPSLAIDLAVKSAKIVNGYWEVFPDSAAWGEGSGLPGQSGNQVIFAHAREGLFLPLRQVSLGMKVYVFTKGSWYQYEVKEIKEVTPSQIEVIAPTEDETLTLYTCTGFSDSKRLIVIAKRAS